MEIAVYDTYVKRTDGRVMHFDVFVPAGTDPEKVLAFGREYLSDKPVESQTLTSDQCRFCHTQAAPDQIQQTIAEQGYFIYEMEGCD